MRRSRLKKKIKFIKWILIITIFYYLARPYLADIFTNLGSDFIYFIVLLTLIRKEISFRKFFSLLFTFTKSLTIFLFRKIIFPLFIKAFRIKTVLAAFVVFIILDFSLMREYGESYTDNHIFLAWTMYPYLIYILLGFGNFIASFIEKRKKYILVSPLIASFFIVLFITIVFIKPPSLNSYPQALLLILLLVIFTACVLLLLFQILKLRKLRVVVFLFNKIRLHKIAVAVNILLVVLLFASIYYGNTKIQTLNNRLEKIETRLGGPEKVNCSDADSVRKVRQSVVRVVGGEAEGSGFAIKSGGVIITNFHVIEFEPSPKVILPDNTFETAEILMADKNADLAILKIEKDLPVVPWGDINELDPAEELLAIGFPFGGDLVGEASVSKGAFAGSRKSKDVGVDYIQTDITFNPGVSGGPMINVCGEAVGINTAGLSGMGLAISADSIKQKWLEMSTSDDSTKDIEKIIFDDTLSGEYAVATFYNYLKVLKLDKAFEILSDNFKQGHGFDYWKQGYESLLDTTVIKIEEDKNKENRINIKLGTKNMVDDEIVYKYFEGYWDVKKVGNKWQLWQAKIKEVEDPDYSWFYE